MRIRVPFAAFGAVTAFARFGRQAIVGEQGADKSVIRIQMLMIPAEYLA